MKTNIRNILISFIFLSSVSGLTNAQYLSELKFQNVTSLFTDTTKRIIRLSEKSPFLAGGLSFFIPGLAFGQLYNKQPEKFFVHLGITGASVLGAVLGIANFRFNVGGQTSNDGNTTIGPVIFLISAGVFAGNWIWSVVDAVISANDLNKKVRLKYNRTFKTNNINFGIGLGRNNKPNFNISVCF